MELTENEYIISSNMAIENE